MKLKVMTYNIASCRNYEHADSTGANAPVIPLRTGDVIKSASPDICGLNEVSHFLKCETEEDTQTAYLSDYSGLKYGFFGKAIHLPAQKRDYGNAVISKYPIYDAEVFPIPDPEIRDEDAYYESRSIIRSKIDIAGGITIIQTHMGLAIAESKNAVSEVCKIIDKTVGPIILMGDFNIRPSNPLYDILREKLFDTALIRQDYFPTFPTYKTNYPNCKIDYIFVSKEFKVTDLQIPNFSVSDHFPYIAELEIDG